MKKFACLMMFALMINAGCGGGTGTSTAKQYTLDVQGQVTIAPVAGAITVEKLNQQQVMIGTMLIEVTSDTAEELGVRVLDMDVNPQTSGDVDFNFILDPNSVSSGVIFKACELGIPFGTSYITLYLAVTSSSPDVELQAVGTQVLINEGQTLVIGGLTATAQADDRSRLPVLADLPVINFLFQSQQHQATVDNLLIILTPQILSDTEG